MLDFLPRFVKGSLSFLLYLINTIVLCSLLFCVALVKLIFPVPSLKKYYDSMLIYIAMRWVGINAFNTDLFNRIEWTFKGAERLEKEEWYLLLCNHQSWVDILVLQKMFMGKVPMLKFFLKKELIWVPILGLAWWALDFPFMRRYSSKFLEKNPHLKGKDLESTKKACEKFKTIPVCVVNFVEGTRFKPEKHKRQKSPYTHLLTPKAGGVAFVISAMGDCMHKIINVTIVYPDGADTFWGFISGRIRRVIVDVDILPITSDIKGDYFNDAQFRERFCTWINTLWKDKDMKISRLLKSPIH
ncbi:MAG: acyltransferase [Desulfamplus sp.]|nr:acyltransferase [Desulfamplus sp.]MBF0411505.1 acyltransferase [Desulfamplus sp.]